MPFLCEINPARGIRAGLWKITETPGELLCHLDLTREEASLFASFRNIQRQRHWLAARAALTCLLAPLPGRVTADSHGKPVLPGGGPHLSLSHAGDFAAAVIRDAGPVGIDIEKITGRIERVRERFLRPTELEGLAADHRLEQLYVFWGAKEALYKMQGHPGVDLRDDIHIHRFDYLCHTDQTATATLHRAAGTSEHTVWWRETKEYMMVVAW